MYTTTTLECIKLYCSKVTADQDYKYTMLND